VGQVAISEAISTTWHSSNCVMIYREREGKIVIQRGQRSLLISYTNLTLQWTSKQ